MQTFLNDNISVFNKISNDDINNILSKKFKDNLLLLKNSCEKIPQSEKFNLNTEIDYNIIKNIINIMILINREFINIYEKIFQFDYRKNSNKLNEIKNDINNLFPLETKINDSQNLENSKDINDMYKSTDIYSNQSSNNNNIENEKLKSGKRKNLNDRFQKFLDSHSYLSISNLTNPKENTRLTYQVFNTNPY